MDEEKIEVESTEIIDEVIPQEETSSKSKLGINLTPFQTKLIVAALILIFALISAFVLSGVFSNPETYTSINNTLDEKKNNVMALVATSTAASAATAVIPVVSGSGFSDKIADFSTYFLVILAVIYLEKLLLTTIGTIVFCVMVPGSCVLFIISLFIQKGKLVRRNLQNIATKLLAFGLALFLVVPVSVWITDSIDSTYEASMMANNAAAQEAINELENEVNAEEQQEEEKGFFESIASTVQSGINSLTKGAQDALDNFTKQMNNLIDTFAVMVVTSCLIPLIVLAVFMKLASIVSGIDYGGAGGAMNAVNSKRKEMFKRTKKKSSSVKSS